MSKRVFNVFLILVVVVVVSISIAGIMLNTDLSSLNKRKAQKRIDDIRLEVSERYLEKYWDSKYNSFYINQEGKRDVNRLFWT